MKRSSKSSPLTLSALTPITIRQLADPKSFARGEAYFAEDRVLALEERSGKIVATVLGSAAYRVQMGQKGNELDYDCSCPRGEDGDFCKHCVAVGLALLAENPAVRKGHRNRDREMSMDDVRRHLEGETKATLINLLVERADTDSALLDQLRLRVAKHHHRGGVDIAAFKTVLRRTITPRDFLEWREVSGHVAGIHRVVDSLDALISEGEADSALELVEYALAQVERAINSVDDSDGEMSTLLERLQGLHHHACQKAKPESVALAKRLFEWEMRSDWDVFHGAAARYADVFGDKGIGEYRRLATEAWDKVPALGPGQTSPDQYGRWFRITSIMRTLAQHAGDVEAEAQVLQRDLSSAYRFLEIASLYRQAGKDELALAWAEKGVAAFPNHTDGRLREFLAEEYHRRQRHDDAMALAWAAFAERPSLDEFKQLKAHAKRAQCWQHWRDKALATTREKIAEIRSRTVKSSWDPLANHSLLVAIYLSEKDPEAAWQEALTGGCSSALWLALAEQREQTHPEDALPIYKRHLELTLAQTNNAAYEAGIRLLHRIRTVMDRMGQETSFAGYLSSVRADFARKRNFIRLVEETRWS